MRSGARIALGILAAAAGVLAVRALRRRQHPPLEVVSGLDLGRYAGTWYEIARLPFAPERGCWGAQAIYRARPDGGLDVVNRCRRGGPNGRISEIHGRAVPASTDGGARFRVQFGPLIRGDYEVIALDDDYQWAVVGTRGRRQLWFLSRTPVMLDARFQELVRHAARQGFDVSRLERTPQELPAGLPRPDGSKA